MENNLPKLVNPMQDLMLGMPMLPQILQSTMPAIMPQMQYDDNVVKMIFGNFKRKRIAKAYELEASIAEDANRKTTATMDSIFQVLTISSKTADALGEYEHRKTMRGLAVQKAQAEVYMIQAQAKQAGHEAQLSELEYNIKIKQYKKMEAEND